MAFEFKGLEYATEAEAYAAIAIIDAALGYPNADTDTWTLPIRLINPDGWLVQQPDGSGPVIPRERVWVEPEE